MALTQVETSGLSGSGASSNSTTGNVFSQTGPFKNRIINGDMRIDQRNAGASVSTASGNNAYTLDRFQIYYAQTSKFTVQQNAGSVTPPAGFSNYLGITSSSAYSSIAADYFFVRQHVEGYNIADLAWGTANASAVTLSFWVRSSLTGTFAGVLRNSAENLSYVFTYSISSANTWTAIKVNIAGPTTGTWLTTNGIGVEVHWDIGSGSNGKTGTTGSWQSGGFFSATGATSVVGTNGATFYITGVQLEAGSVATPFERRSYGQELSLCQRYYTYFGGKAGSNLIFQGYGGSSSFPTTNQLVFPSRMRTSPTIAREGTWTSSNVSTLDFGYVNEMNLSVGAVVSSAGNFYIFADSADDKITASAEL